MRDRVSVLLGAGAVTAGVAAALLAGAGVAVAAPESTSTSQSQSQAQAQADSAGGEDSTESRVDTLGPDADPDDAAPETEDTVEDPDGAEGDADQDAGEEGQDAGEDAEEEEGGDDSSEEAGGADAAVPDEPAGRADDAVGSDRPDAASSDHPDIPDSDAAEQERVDAEAAAGGAEAPVMAEQPVASIPVDAPAAGADPAVAEANTAVLRPLASMQVAPADEAASSPRKQTLLSVIGAVIFNIYSVAIRVLGGPPILPPNSTVTVRSSKLRIDCGDGYDVPADWYVPDGATPTRLIYFQHGFMAAGPFYSYTAARLAEATNSIVVATSLTSNFLACDGCWVGGTQMHRAVADLFVDGNTALAQSALAAGYSGTLLDGIDKVGLTGHSAGGGLAVGAAGHMTRNGSFDKLAGVVMLDGVGFGDVTPQALAKLPLDFPIYNLAARSYYWNLSGTTNAVLQQWRPGEFNGVKLDNSSHGDAMSAGNIFVQVAMNLVTGWPRPANVAAAEILSAGWFNDMFSGTPPSAQSGFYGAPDDVLQIPTARGTATARVLPGPTERQTFFDWLFTTGARIMFGINFATCAVDAGEGFGRNYENSVPNTALSLDGRTKPGQSIGQQCVHG